MPDEHDTEPSMTIPVAAYEALGERAARAETALAAEHLRQHEMLADLNIGWPPGEGFYQTITDYIETLRAAIRVRETFANHGHEHES